MTGERGEAAHMAGLLSDVARWSVPVALAVAVAGSLIAGDVRVGVSCLIGAAFDIGTLHIALLRTGGAEPLTSLFVVRLLVKGALLVAVAFVPRVFSLLGMAAGVLVVDLTLATAGSASAVWHSFRPGHTGG